MTKLEVCGAAFGLVSVWLTVRASIWCWPTGLVSTALFMVMFAEARLYGDVVTNAMFCVVGVYGWLAWGRAVGDGGAIHWASRRARVVMAAVVAAGIPVCGWVFTRVGGALPYWDAAIMVMSFVAQLLLARKVVESWVMWILVDVISVAVYASRGLVATAGLYVVFLVLAWRGLVAWSRESGTG